MINTCIIVLLLPGLIAKLFIMIIIRVTWRATTPVVARLYMQTYKQEPLVKPIYIHYGGTEWHTCEVLVWHHNVQIVDVFILVVL